MCESTYSAVRPLVPLSHTPQTTIQTTTTAALMLQQQQLLASVHASQPVLPFLASSNPFADRDENDEADAEADVQVESERRSVHGGGGGARKSHGHRNYGVQDTEYSHRNYGRSGRKAEKKQPQHKRSSLADYYRQ